jgi:hypothetical protein
MILDGSVLSHFTADGPRIEGNLSPCNAIMRGKYEDDTLSPPGTYIGEQFDLPNNEIINTTGTALRAEDLSANAGPYLRNAITRRAGEDGTVRLLGAHIGGQLDLTRSKIVNNAGPVFTVDGLRTDDNLYLRNATIRGAGELGAVRLPGAHIGGRLHLDGLSVTNDTGTALHADSLHTAYDLFLRGATVRGSAKNGALRLDGAHIGGQADLTGTR